MSSEISIRRALREDLEFLFEMRNDVAVVEASATGKGVDRHIHVLWFDQKLQENAMLFVAEARGNRIGYIRFDPIDGRPGDFEVAVGLVERYRHKGFGRALISLGSEIAEALGARSLTALIRPENTASRKAFEAASYELDSATPLIASKAGVALVRYVRRRSSAEVFGPEPNLVGRCRDVAEGLTANHAPHRFRFLLVADAGVAAGLGHLRRMQALGDALLAFGFTYAIAVLPDAGGAATRSERRPPPKDYSSAESIVGRRVLDLERIRSCRNAFDICVLDSYRASPDDAALLDPVLAMADGAPPPIGAPIILDPSPGAEEEMYLEEAEVVLAGEKFALLTFPFWNLDPPKPHYPPRNVFISLGAAGDPAFVDAVASAVTDVMPGVTLNLPSPDTLPPEYFRMLCSADVVITAGGVTSLEAARAGRPMVGVVLADNQRENIEGLSRKGALLSASADPDAIAKAVREVAENEALFRRLSACGPRVIDGIGACRTAAALISYLRDSRTNSKAVTP